MALYGGNSNDNGNNYNNDVRWWGGFLVNSIHNLNLKFIVIWKQYLKINIFWFKKKINIFLLFLAKLKYY